MLIKPFKPVVVESPISLKGGFTKSIDGSKYVRKRVYSNTHGSVRIEEMIIDSKKHTLTKCCTFGKFDRSPLNFSKYIDVDDYMEITTDLKTGKRISYNTYSGIPNNSSSITKQILGNSIGLMSKTIMLNDNDTIYNTDSIDELFHTEYDKQMILSNIYAVEDLFQIGYSEMVGFISAFFSQWEFCYPIESIIIIDTKTSTFSIKKFEYLQGIIDKEAIYSISGAYVRDLENLTKLLSYNAEKEKRNFRIMVYNTSFTSIIKIKDIHHPNEINECFKPSASNHFKTMINNAVSKSDYDLSEEAGYIVTSSNGDVSSEMLESISYIDSI